MLKANTPLYLKKYRLDRGLTLREAAKSIGISSAHLAFIERGEIRSCLYSTLEKISAFYGLSIEELKSPCPELDPED